MPETLTISIGQAGNQIAKQFWNLSLQEQAKNSDSSVYDESLATFFRNSDPSNGIQCIPVGNGGAPLKYIKARGLLVDMEEKVVNGIKASPVGQLFDQQQIILSNSGSGNNWGQGYHHYGSIFKEDIVNAIRREAEFCDSLQSIITLQAAVIIFHFSNYARAEERGVVLDLLYRNSFGMNCQTSGDLVLLLCLAKTMM